MRRVFIIRKDLNLRPGKLGAMVGHCAEGFWTNLLKRGNVKDLESDVLPVSTSNDPDYWKRYRAPDVYALAKAAHERGEKTFAVPALGAKHKYMISVEVDKDMWDKYANGIFTKTICECKNLNQLQKAEDKAKELGLVKGVDYDYINDNCLTDLTPENPDGTCTIGMWFAPLEDDIAHQISKKFKLYGAFDK